MVFADLNSLAVLLQIEPVTHRTLQPVDLAIILSYFVVIFGIGFYFSRKERTSEDYFLASRNIGWFAIGASLFVSNISTEHSSVWRDRERLPAWRRDTMNGWPY